MITGRQMRAARALLGWDAVDLAKKTGLTRETICRIETDLVRAQEKSLVKIVRALDENGIEFTENQGVRLKPKSVETLEDSAGFARFYDYLYEHLSQHGGSICISGVDERLYAKYRPNAEADAQAHRERMAELVKQRDDIKARILVEEGDYNFVASEYATYRWQPKKHFTKTSFYVFGHCLALISFDHEPPPLIILIKSATFAEAYRNAFDIAWENSIVPPPKPEGKGK